MGTQVYSLFIVRKCYSLFSVTAHFSTMDSTTASRESHWGKLDSLVGSQFKVSLISWNVQISDVLKTLA